MAIQVDSALQITVTETVGNTYVSSNSTFAVDGMNESDTLTGSTTVPVTKWTAYAFPLVSGSLTIDLTSLPDYQGTLAAVTFTGLKPQRMKLRCKATNANAITIAKGASNGYTGFGSSFSVTLQPGDSITFRGNDNSGVTDVGSSAKTLDITGTGAQVLEVLIAAG